MKRALVGVMSVAACTLAFTGIAAALDCPGGVQNPSGLNSGSGPTPGVKLALHAVPFNDVKSCAANAPSGLACDGEAETSNLITEFPLNTRASVYMVALDIPILDGFKGASFGLDFDAFDYGPPYSGVFINGWTLCMDLSFPSADPLPDFPQDPGSGVVITSASCLGAVADPSDPQGEGSAVMGWLDVTVYSAGLLNMTPRLYLANPDFQVADCDAAASNPCYPLFAGAIGFGAPGYDPCVSIIVPTIPTTWGNIKKGLGE